MAAGTITIFLTNGQTLSIYDASSEAVNAEKRCSLTGTAVSTSPFGFTVSSRCCIRDMVVLTSVDGEFEITKNGVRTGKKIPVHAGFAVSVDRTMQNIPKLCFEPGVQYGCLQTMLRSA